MAVVVVATVVRRCCLASVMLCASMMAQADEAAVRTSMSNARTWQNLATQTCVAQAPSNPYISKLNMPVSHLQYTCQCVVRDVYQNLSRAERDHLLQQMRQRQNLRAVGEKIFARPEVKQTALTCSAKYYWQ